MRAHVCSAAHECGPEHRAVSSASARRRTPASKRQWATKPRPATTQASPRGGHGRRQPTSSKTLVVSAFTSSRRVRTLTCRLDRSARAERIQREISTPPKCCADCIVLRPKPQATRTRPEGRSRCRLPSAHQSGLNNRITFNGPRRQASRHRSREQMAPPMRFRHLTTKSAR